MSPRRRPAAPDAASIDPRQAADQILADERVVWFPVKHYSPACAWHVRRVIEATRPAAVLVEGPDDATPLIEHIIASDTAPPLTLLSTYVDKRDRFGLNGVLSAAPHLPARLRAWWPLVGFAPEYQALVAGAAVGAELAFIDAPLPATIPHHQVPSRRAQRVVGDRHLAESAYFQALGRRGRRRSFEAFWQARFEAGGAGMETDAFMRAVLVFAWCTRHVGADGEGAARAHAADGTTLREAHMRWHVDKALKAHPGERVVVVTGAYHSVALPWVKGARAKAKADRYTETLLTAHSFAALARLYEMSRLPAYGQRCWDELAAGRARPLDEAASGLIVEIMRAARDGGVVVSTADAVGAWQAAQNLAVLRGDPQVTLHDLADAVEMTFVKGDKRLRAGPVELAARSVLVGSRQGRVCEAAGQPPLLRDFYERAREHRVDVGGDLKVLRCDLHKHDKHRLKSAFLHRCAFLELPLFAPLDDGNAWRPSTHYRGPDLVTGEGMELITETWGVQWGEEVDDRLVELSGVGASIVGAAGALLEERLPGVAASASDATKLLLRGVQMRLTDRFERVLAAVEDAIGADTRFTSLVDALADFVVLHSYRDAVATQGHERLRGTIVTLFGKACLALPGVVAADDAHLAETMTALQTLVRVALTFEAAPLDRQLLIEKVRQAVAAGDGNPALRGAGYGVLFAFGSTRERAVARELEGYALGSAERAPQAGAFLDGLLGTSKSIFLGSARLLRAVDRVLARLDWETFKVLLPDLRRAFTQFIPTEIDAISARVRREIGLAEAAVDDGPVPEALVRVAAETDRRAQAVLEGWV